MIKIVNVSKIYSSKTNINYQALTDINLTLPKEGFISILGASGSGKSTLLNLIGGLDKPSSGHIFINNKSIDEFDDKKMDSYRNKNVGFVLQNCYLIPQLSVIENIILPLKVNSINDKEAKKKAISYLDKLNIGFLKDKKVNELSGGQAQKICIIRAIINNPKIILADEPTGALDSKSSIEILDILKKLSKDHLVIMVTHNEELASIYSDRKITLKDGQVISDSLNVEIEEENDVEELKSKLSFSCIFKMSIKNIFSKKLKSLFSSITNSLGVIALGFFLALNLGFQNYSNRLSSEQASSLPVILSSYTVNNKTEEFNKVNFSEEYTSNEEIYPSISLSSSYTYKRNNFSLKYINYLSSLKEEGILKDYVNNYGSSYSFNLMSKYPTSLDTTSSSSAFKVDTTLNSYNYYASLSSLPSNIFHVLYGDTAMYDLIAGDLPTNKNQLLLVVDRYNAVSFNILKQLGFYNPSDKEEDVKSDDEKKVKPISFNDILNKKYKIFTNDEFYIQDSKEIKVDGLNNNREITYYKQADTDSNLFEDESKGIQLEISGIIRPKASSMYTLLSPALCYTPQLQEELVNINKTSALSSSYKESYILKNSSIDLSQLTNEINSLKDKFEKENDIPVSEFNSLVDKYFTFFVPYLENKNADGSYIKYYYTSFSSYLNDARNHSSIIIEDEISNMDLNDKENIISLLNNTVELFLSGDNEKINKAYNNFLSLSSLLNAYSLINAIVLFPTSLENRQILLSKLDEFNVIKDDNLHAKDESEKVFYQEENDNALIQDVAEAISLTNMILIVFSVIAFIVSICMIIFMITNNVLERQKEIGLLRAVGVSKKAVSLMFVIESSVLGLFSGIIGALVTYIFCFPLNTLINNRYSYYKVGNIACFTFPHALIIISISLVVSIIASYIPSILASRNDPVKSLRSE